MNSLFKRLTSCFGQPGRVSLIAAVLLWGTVASGLPVNDLYSSRVAVSNESSGERQRAFREALAQVILKVSGDRRWLLEPAVESAIQEAQSFVEAVSYSSEMIEQPAPAPESGQQPEEPEQQLEELEQGNAEDTESDATESPTLAQSILVEQRFIEVDFSRDLVQQLLAEAGIPLWDANRPSVLLWLIVQEPDGERHFLSRESDPELLALIEDFASRRGLPVLFPLLDFPDRQALSAEQLWSLDEASIAGASARYGADSVLAGRLHFTATGELLGLWQFQFRDETIQFDGLDTALQAYLDPALDRVTTSLANYYAIPVTGTGGTEIGLRVEDVRDLQDYAALISYLRGLGLVEYVLPRRLDQQRVDLQLSIVGDSRQLMELIQLDRDLLPLSGSDPMGLLHYRWTR